ncbi:MAG: hypothetical protein ACI9UO_003126 [Nitrospinales bacterium]|jgi:hypothetical protein
MPVVAKGKDNVFSDLLIIAQFFLDFNGVTHSSLRFNASSTSTYLPIEIR